MNKTAQTEYFRLFLIEKLPDPLLPKSAHLQLFDNYIENTRMRLRIVRDPQSKEWTRILQQRIDSSEAEHAPTKLSEIYLNEAEYAALERFEGREIRKNRYFHEFDSREMTFDVYIGNLWGLHTARVDFESAEDRDAYEPPPFAVFDVTGEAFFSGWRLVEKKFADVQTEVAKLEILTRLPVIAAQE